MILLTSFNVAFLCQAGHILVCDEGNIVVCQGVHGCGSEQSGGHLAQRSVYEENILISEMQVQSTLSPLNRSLADTWTGLPSIVSLL